MPTKQAMTYPAIVRTSSNDFTAAATTIRPRPLLVMRDSAMSALNLCSRDSTRVVARATSWLAFTVVARAFAATSVCRFSRSALEVSSRRCSSSASSCARLASFCAVCGVANNKPARVGHLTHRRACCTRRCART